MRGKVPKLVLPVEQFRVGYIRVYRFCVVLDDIRRGRNLLTHSSGCSWQSARGRATRVPRCTRFHDAVRARAVVLCTAPCPPPHPACRTLGTLDPGERVHLSICPSSCSSCPPAALSAGCAVRRLQDSKHTLSTAAGVDTGWTHARVVHVMRCPKLISALTNSPLAGCATPRRLRRKIPRGPFLNFFGVPDATRFCRLLVEYADCVFHQLDQ